MSILSLLYTFYLTTTRITDDTHKTVDLIIGMGYGVIIGYIISYAAFYYLRKAASKKDKRLLLKLGNIGLTILILGQVSFTVYFAFLTKYGIVFSFDYLMLLLTIALMVFYVIYCNNEMRDLDL